MRCWIGANNAPSGLSRSKHYQTPHLVTESVLAQSTAFEHQQRRCAASAV